MTGSETSIPLSDLIEAVRSELETAAAQAKERSLQFEVDNIELDVEIATTGTREAAGGIKVWVLSVGAKASKASSSSHRVKLSLGAVTTDGKKYKVSDVPSRPVSNK
jgi:hypothetical protein